MNLPPVLVSGALALSLLAQPAAAESTATRSIKVPTADLDLASVEGRNTLDLRVRSAVRSVCAPIAQSLDERLDYAQCLTGALASAEPQVTIMLAARQKTPALASR